jgi:hypothetical protein
MLSLSSSDVRQHVGTKFRADRSIVLNAEGLSTNNNIPYVFSPAALLTAREDIKNIIN